MKETGPWFALKLKMWFVKNIHTTWLFVSD